MAKVLMPLPRTDFDPSEAAVSWSVLKRMGHSVAFATADGRPGRADEMMLTGEGLDFWGFLPGCKHIVLLGRLMRANAQARRAYASMMEDPAYRSPVPYQHVRREDFGGLVLPGGHRARGMCEYLESDVLHQLVAEFFAVDAPVAAICHGVLLAARSRRTDGRSVLFGRRTTALTWALERAAWRIGRIVRFWDPNYYRTYEDGPGRPEGYMSVQQEVTRALARPEDFAGVPAGAPDYWRKTSGMARDTFDDDRPAFVVRDGNYVSARWPGDAHTFARAFAAVLAENGDKHKFCGIERKAAS
jgi:putative intracellular protease/amidase